MPARVLTKTAPFSMHQLTHVYLLARFMNNDHSSAYTRLAQQRYCRGLIFTVWGMFGKNPLLLPPDKSCRRGGESAQQQHVLSLRPGTAVHSHW